jgi:hypothetical protein
MEDVMTKKTTVKAACIILTMLLAELHPGRAAAEKSTCNGIAECFNSADCIKFLAPKMARKLLMYQRQFCTADYPPPITDI